MEPITYDKLKAMPDEEVKALNSKLTKKFAAHMVGMLWFKLAVSGVSTVLVKKAIIEAAKRVP